MTGSRRAARAAILLGVLAVAAIPAGIVAAQRSSGLRLLETLYVAVPVAVVLGVLAVGSSRRARFEADRSVRPDARGGVRLARIVAWCGLYAGITGALALAVYGLLRFAQS
jgi:ABC-type transport system involved in cytochrome c biogenesis permease subunit